MPQKTFGLIVVGLFAAILVVQTTGNRRLWNGGGGEPEILSFDEDDSEMNAAMVQARESIGTFLQALQDSKPGRSNYSIKVGFRDPHGQEFMWLSEICYGDESLRGRVANTPQTVHSPRYGASVTVSKDEIADWMFIENGVLQGGYTMRVMRNRLPPEDRSQFDANINFSIE